jgi:hypothetical protein
MPRRSTDVDRNSTSPRRLKAAKMLSLGKSLNDVCKECDISSSTLHRYRDDPYFMDTVDRLSKEAFQELLPKAVERLNSLLDSPNQLIRLKASKIVLDKTMPNLTENNSKNLTAIKVQVEYV